MEPLTWDMADMVAGGCEHTLTLEWWIMIAPAQCLLQVQQLAAKPSTTRLGSAGDHDSWSLHQNMTQYTMVHIIHIYIYCGKDSPLEIDIYLLIFLWHDLKRFEESVGFSVWWPVSICFLQNRWLQQGLTRTTWLISPRCIMCIDSGPQIHPKGVASTISADLFSRAHAALKKRSQWSHRAEKPMLRKS